MKSHKDVPREKAATDRRSIEESSRHLPPAESRLARQRLLQAVMLFAWGSISILDSGNFKVDTSEFVTWLRRRGFRVEATDRQLLINAPQEVPQGHPSPGLPTRPKVPSRRRPTGGKITVH